MDGFNIDEFNVNFTTDHNYNLLSPKCEYTVNEKKYVKFKQGQGENLFTTTWLWMETLAILDFLRRKLTL